MGFCNVNDLKDPLQRSINIRHIDAIDDLLHEMGMPLIEPRTTWTIQNPTYLLRTDNTYLLHSRKPIIKLFSVRKVRGSESEALTARLSPTINSLHDWNEDSHMIEITGGDLQRGDAIEIDALPGLGRLSVGGGDIDVWAGDFIFRSDYTFFIIRANQSRYTLPNGGGTVKPPELLIPYAVWAVRRLAAYENDTSGKMGRLNITRGWEEILERYMP